ncbi:MAG TPA: macrolide family glycosyltransferase [Ktedonobacteraceae bacterium]
MAKFVFINIPSRSHITPTLPIVRELVARGDKVTYYLAERFRSLIEETGAEFRPFATMIDQINNTAFASGKPVGLPMYMVEESLYVIPQILESVRAEQPDCIVYDTMCLSGRFIAEILNIPAVNFRMIFAFNQHLARIFQANASQDPAGIEGFQKSMRQICDLYQLKPFHLGSIFTHEESLNLVTIPRAFQLQGDTFDDRYCFVGPALDYRDQKIDFPFQELEGQTVIYITQGTVYNDRPNFFNLCIDAFAGTPWKVVISIGTNVDQSKLQAIPDNFIIRTFLPQLEILKYASVCIYHGSMTTAMESLAQGTPIVAVPPSLADQVVNARRIAELGLGIHLDEKTVTAESLYSAVAQVINDPRYASNVQKMQEEIRSSGGYKRAVDVLQHFVQVPV